MILSPFMLDLRLLSHTYVLMFMGRRRVPAPRKELERHHESIKVTQRLPFVDTTIENTCTKQDGFLHVVVKRELYSVSRISSTFRIPRIRRDTLLIPLINKGSEGSSRDRSIQRKEDVLGTIQTSPGI